MATLNRINALRRKFVDLSTASLKNLIQPAREELVIFDDIYPLAISGFRLAEFNSYLDYFKSAAVYTTGDAFAVVGEKSTLKDVISRHLNFFSGHFNRVRVFNCYSLIESKLAYVVFLHNAYRFLPFIEKNKLPFVFTLYPGGAFKINDLDSDRMLATVCASPEFRKVIVTQKITYDYLLKNNFCSEDKIEFIYGVVPSIEGVSKKIIKKIELGTSKNAFDICFVAHKYMPQGEDKGYDTFIAAAKLISAKCKDVVFHVVGTFTAEDIDTDVIGDIRFYGPQKNDFFADFYRSMDLIIAPNVPFKLQPGAFDGFPTGCCVDAALAGVAVFNSDTLGQNIYFTDHEDIVIIDNDAYDIMTKVMEYYQDYNKLLALSRKGQRKFEEVFNMANQMQPRIALLESQLRAG